jgi:hypothetical protein
LCGNFFALAVGGSVAPKFRGADDFACLVERDEAMLLAADTDAFDLASFCVRLLQWRLDR